MATETTLVNPLREGLRLQRTPEPCVMVIFGASGDLTRRKLVPALYNLTRERLLAPNFAVIGVARRPIGTENFREQMKGGINEFSRVRPVQENIWNSFSQGIYYHQTEFHDDEHWHPKYGCASSPGSDFSITPSRPNVAAQTY